LDAAPFAGVLFLLVIFLTFDTALVFVPGLPLQLPAAPPGRGPLTNLVAIDARQRFHYGKQVLTEEEFAQRLRADCQSAARPGVLVVKADPAVTNAVLARLLDLTRELKLAVDLPGARIDLPMAEQLPGAARPTVVVAVDLSGQIYFESQVVQEESLQARLASTVRQAKEPPTLVLLADKAVPYELIVRLGTVARAAGIREVLLAARPPIFPPSQP
jgi:biopolymer transport protein ExbD